MDPQKQSANLETVQFALDEMQALSGCQRRLFIASLFGATSVRMSQAAIESTLMVMAEFVSDNDMQIAIQSATMVVSGIGSTPFFEGSQGHA